MRRFIGAGVLTAALVASIGLAQDGPVTIKIKKPAAGESTKETKTEKAVNKIGISVMGMNQTKEEGGNSEFVYTDKVIERPQGAKKPTKMERKYDKAKLVVKGEDENLDLAGKTVMIEKKGDKYEFAIGGQAVSGKAAEILGKEFNKKTDTTEEVFLPKNPVKVGDSWKPDVAELTKELAEDGMTIDTAKSTCTAKLTKLYMKDSVQYGVIQIDMELVVTKVGGGGMEIPLNAGSKLVARVELDGCVDGKKANGTSKMSMKGNLAGEVMGVALTIALDATNNGTSEEVGR